LPLLVTLGQLNGKPVGKLSVPVLPFCQREGRTHA